MKYRSWQYGRCVSVPSGMMEGDWEELRTQLLLQWPQLLEADLDKAGPNRHRIALIIERKYGISYEMVESYLSNFERKMPMLENKMNYRKLSS